jgi:hypothetical protein
VGHFYFIEIIREQDYKEWPLFKEFRRSGDFLNAYQEVFSHPLAQIEEVQTKLPKIKLTIEPAE